MLTRIEPDADQNSPRIVPSEIRDQRSDVGKGKDYRYSPNPFPNRTDSDVWSTQREVWHHLTAGLGALSENDYGRPWPLPHRKTLAALVAKHDADQCIAAAKTTRQIVVAQDRAPNITALFAKKLAELTEVRDAIREAL